MSTSNFGRALEDAMQAFGLTAYRLSKLTDIPQPSISRLINGERVPTRQVMGKLRAVFDEQNLQILEMSRAMDILIDEGIEVDESILIQSIDPDDWMGGRVRLVSEAEARHEAIEEAEWGGKRRRKGAARKVSPGKRESVIQALEKHSASSVPVMTIGATEVVYLPVFADISRGWADEPSDGKESAPYPTFLVAGADRVFTIYDGRLKDAGFRPGTHVFVKSKADARDGQTVIARIDGGDHACRIYRNSGARSWLETWPQSFRDRIYLETADVEILGVVVSWWGVGPIPLTTPGGIEITGPFSG